MMNKYGLIGKDVSYSMSKVIHDFLFNYYNIKGTYELISINSLENINLRHYKGLNVTIPYKKKVMQKLDNIDQKAMNLGVINTVVNNESVLDGYNTDILGFDRFYKQNINSIQLVGIFGNSATASMLSYYLESKNIKYIIFTRDKQSSQIKDSQKTSKNSNNFLGYHLYEHITNFNIDFIINTTPLGQGKYIAKTSIDKSVLKNIDSLKYILDFNYNPFNTKLILDGKSLGIKTFNGLEILIAQAIYSFEIWNNIKVEESVFLTTYEHVLLKLVKGIVIYGMPLSGKSFYYNKLLEEKSNNVYLYDLDLEIQKNLNKSIVDYVKENGIKEFRKIENFELNNIINYKIDLDEFKIIFLGGGTLTEVKNIYCLQDYAFYYNKVNLKTLLERLDFNEVKKRPLIKSEYDFMDLYNTRKVFYDNIFDQIFLIDKIKQILRNF